MPYKLTGTLIVLFLYGCVLSFLTISLSSNPANAQLSELTEIQNGVFHLSHKNMGITSETFANDKYIDDEQAEFFREASKPKINTPADDNYPFTLVDHYLLNSDLEIDDQYDNILCNTYPKNMYLSRHNISIADFTDQKSPPEVFTRTVKSKEPFHNKNVKAAVWTLNNYEYHRNEIIHNYNFQNGPYKHMDHCAIDGYVIDTTVRVVSGNVAVWLHTDTPYYLQQQTVKPRIDCCLPKSYCPEPKYAQVKWAIPAAWNWQEVTPIRPKSSCEPLQQSPSSCKPCLICK